MITVDEIMTTQVVTVQPEDSLLSCMGLMADHNIRHLPVVNKHHQLLGIVSHRDLLRADLSCLSTKKGTEETSRETINNATVSDIMNTSVKTATPLTGFRSVGLLLQKEKFGCVPITDKGILVGIITDTDFVSAAITLVEEMEFFENNTLDPTGT